MGEHATEFNSLSGKSLPHVNEVFLKPWGKQVLSRFTAAALVDLM